MPLIYLDTANFSAYVAARSRHQAQFRTKWRNGRATLALSFTHVCEFRQHGSPGEREERYAALGDFLPIRTELSLAEPGEATTDVVDREILASAARHGLRTDKPVVGLIVEGDRAAVDPFPWTVADRTVLREGLQHAEQQFFAAGLGDLRVAIAIGTIAQSRPIGTAAPEETLDDLSDAPLTPQEVAERRARVAATFGPLLMPAAGAGAVSHAIIDTQLALIDRAAAVGTRRAAIEAFEREFGYSLDAKALRRPLRELRLEAKFRERVRGVLDRHCGGAPETDRAAVSRAIRLVECPGRWLWHAIDAQALKAEPQPAPGNYWDFEHATYMPYVDRFFTDKRIATFIEQSLRAGDPPRGLAPTAVRRNAATLSELGQLLDL